MLFPLLAGASRAAVSSLAGASGQRRPRLRIPGWAFALGGGGHTRYMLRSRGEGLPSVLARSSFPEAPWLSHPSVRKALAAAEPLWLWLDGVMLTPGCQSRSGAAWLSLGEGTKGPATHCTLTAPALPSQKLLCPHRAHCLCPEGRVCHPRPTTGQPPAVTMPCSPPATPLCQAAGCPPSSSWGRSPQARPCSRCLASATPGTCEKGELSQTLLGPAGSASAILALPRKYFGWHSPLAEGAEMCARR